MKYTMNPQQELVLQNVDGIKLVVAGPGTGKTHTLTHFLAKIISTGKAKPGEILAVTFTNRAADEMKERILDLTGKKPIVSTIHSFAATFLREFPPAGFTKTFRIIEEREQYGIVQALIKKHDIDQHPSFILEKLTLTRNLRNFAMLKQEGLDTFYRTYFNHLKKNDRIDFDGLLTLCLVGLEKNSAASTKYRQKFKYIMVDEFQDISPAQYEIIKHLAAGYKHLLCVGDFDQSIYSFRGADVSIMLNLNEDFPDTELLYLEQNYRSTKKIVQAANNLISKNKHRKKKPHWSDGQEGAAPFISGFRNTEEEAGFIASCIKEEIAADVRAGDIAVLFRINALSQELESMLSNENIKYQIVGGTGFFQRREIQDILSFVTLIQDPHDTRSLYRARSVLSRINKNPQIPLQDLIETLQRQVGLQKIYKIIVQQTGFLEYLQQDTSTKGERRIESVEKLGIVFARQDELGHTVRDFLNYIQNTQTQETNDEDSVKLITFHSAKGLEFHTVFVAGVTDGMVPYHKAKASKEIEEERRMFYVAITRAKKNLFITYPRFNGRSNTKPSPFIGESTTSHSGNKDLSNKFIKTGSMVHHKKWGKGRVLSLSRNRKGEKEIRVQFSSVGVKRLLMEYAPIEFVE